MQASHTTRTLHLQISEAVKLLRCASLSKTSIVLTYKGPKKFSNKVTYPFGFAIVSYLNCGLTSVVG